MQINVPQIWPSTSYVRPISKQLGGQMAYTHLAEVRNISGELCRAYVKHFPNNQPRALFNECFGHAVMSAMGVPQPPCAVMLAPVFEADPPMIAWSFVSCQPRPTFDGTPKEIYKIEDAVALSILIKRIFSCPMLPLLIAADQLVMNGDRNLGNLVFTGKRAFVAIDHGEIMGGGAGTNDALLRPTCWAVSKLIEELVSISAVPHSVKSATLAAASVIEEQFFQHQIEIKKALNADTNLETSIALDAVWWRCLDLAKWFENRLQLI